MGLVTVCVCAVLTFILHADVTWATTHQDLQQVLDSDESQDTSHGDFTHTVIRRDADQAEIRTTFSSSRYALGLTRVEITSLRERRSAQSRPKNIWPSKIPYVFLPSYPKYARRFVKMVTDYLNDHLCVTYIDVTDTYNRSDSTWFTDNGFDLDVYLEISRPDDACTAIVGRAGKTKGPLGIKPCIGWDINLHEFLHTLGVTHAQNDPNRDQYMQVNTGNLKTAKRTSYKKSSPYLVVNGYFDSASPMLYTQYFESAHGLEIWFPVMDDLFALEGGYSDALSDLSDLNRIYKCNENYCNNSQVDCGRGYYSLIEGKCRCMCPEGLDWTTNCQTHLYAGGDVSGGPSWPDTPFMLPGPECPSGFEVGEIVVKCTTKPDQHVQAVKPYDVYLGRLTIPMCTKTTPTLASEVDWSSWKGSGRFCVFKPKNFECEGYFVPSVAVFQARVRTQIRGTVGDVTFTSNTTTFRLCCQTEGRGVLNLPNREPFRLIAFDKNCPTVPGMFSVSNFYILYTNEPKVTGAKEFKIWPDQLHMYQCFYIPANIGLEKPCSHTFELNSTHPSVVLTSPTEEGKRRPKTRCQFDFKVPRNAQIKLSFEKFNLHSKDRFRIKRDHQWQNWYRLPSLGRPEDIVSVRDYMSIEYWSSWVETTRQGFTLTAEVLLAENACYDVRSGGIDYAGEKALTETYEECVEWVKATSCDDFPFDGVFTHDLFVRGNNKCRNPDGSMVGPWCYTYVNGNECMKRYCDVCDYKKPKNTLSGCNKKIEEDPTFCTDTKKSLGCFKSCNGDTQDPVSKAYRCPAPPTPTGSTPMEALKSEYRIKDTVTFNCDLGCNMTTECTATGWTRIKSACDEGSLCVDKLAKCEQYAEIYPKLCLAAGHTRLDARFYCRKTCGVCTYNANNCTLPEQESSYAPVGADDTVKVGHHLEVACSPDLHHTGGLLDRFCSNGGSFLGEEPQCTTKPVSVDLGLELVRKRSSSLIKNRGILLDVTGYRIPFNGTITQWYYHCENDGLITMMVFRKQRSRWSRVGNNTVSCDANRVSSHQVDVSEQISVVEGDVFGAHGTTAKTLSFTQCLAGGPMRPLVTSARRVEDLTFTKTRGCIVPSLGIRLEP